ncbi:MAG: response regulator [Roseinatronobacter sp.]
MAYRIMVVEDEYWIATQLAAMVRERGAAVVGPTGSIPQAIELLSGVDRPDAVVLDILLRVGDVYPFADILDKFDIPFVFATACDKNDIPSRFAHVPHFSKPISDCDCIDAALRLAGGRPPR